MSNIIEFRTGLSNFDAHGVGVLDGATSISPPTQLPMHGTMKMQVCGITISDRIPNFFNARPFYDFDNTKIRVGTGAGFYGDVILPRGLYPDVESVGDAINSALVGLWTNPADPGVNISGNPITDVVTITLDPTKLVPFHAGLLKLDLRKATSNTDIATTLGFEQSAALLSAAVLTKFYSTLEVKMDTQGTLCDIQCSLISVRKRNDTQVRTLALVSFAGKNSPSDNVWPSAGQISPILVYEGGRTLNYLSFEVKTITGQPMLFMGGNLHVVISFIY